MTTNGDLGPVCTGGKGHRIADKEHVAFLIRIIETIFCGERQQIDWRLVSEVTGLKPEQARQRYKVIRKDPELENFAFSNSQFKVSGHRELLLGRSDVAKEGTEIHGYNKGTRVRKSSISNLQIQQTRGRHDLSSSREASSELSKEDLHVYADSELGDPDESDYLLAWVKSSSAQVGKKESASDQIQHSDDIPLAVSRSGRVLHQPAVFTGLVPLPPRNRPRAKHPAKLNATRESSDKVNLLPSGSAVKKRKCLPAGSACDSCRRLRIKCEHSKFHSETVKDVNHGPNLQNINVGQPSVSKITKTRERDGRYAIETTTSEPSALSRDSTIDHLHKRRKLIRMPKLDDNPNISLQKPNAYPTQPNDTSGHWTGEEDVSDEERHKSLDPSARSGLRETKTNEDMRRNSKEHGSSSNSGDFSNSGGNNNMHIHVAGRVLAPSSNDLGVEDANYLLKRRIMALLGGKENYVIRHLDEEESSSEDEALEEGYALYPLDRRKPGASEGLESRDAEVEVLDLT